MSDHFLRLINRLKCKLIFEKFTIKLLAGRVYLFCFFSNTGLFALYFNSLKLASVEFFRITQTELASETNSINARFHLADLIQLNSKLIYIFLY